MIIRKIRLDGIFLREGKTSVDKNFLIAFHARANPKKNFFIIATGSFLLSRMCLNAFNFFFLFFTPFLVFKLPSFFRLRSSSLTYLRKERYIVARFSIIIENITKSNCRNFVPFHLQSRATGDTICIF